jgi:hypothetical protein
MIISPFIRRFEFSPATLSRHADAFSYHFRHCRHAIAFDISIRRRYCFRFDD